MVTTGERSYKRRRSQQERSQKAAKRVANLNRKRGQARLLEQGAQLEAGMQLPTPVSDDDPEDAKHADRHPLAPPSWQTDILDATPGKFVAFEVEYERPKRRGVAVGQVLPSLSIYVIAALLVRRETSHKHICVGD
jgi:hypothetical protein